MAEKSEHIIRQEHFVAGVETERERIIALLEKERKWIAEGITSPPTLESHDAFIDAQMITGFIALIKGDPLRELQQLAEDTGEHENFENPLIEGENK